MSPEQAKGRSVDKRADIWAFGCVLYEMLSGTRAFGGEDISDTLAAVLLRDPDWTALPASVPATIGTLLRRCLEKDRKRRIADISTAMFVIDEPAMAAGATPGTETQTTTQAGLKAGLYTKRQVWIAAAGAAVFLVTAIALGATMYLRRATADTQVTRFFVSPPDGWSLSIGAAFSGSSSTPVTISPDGRTLAFVANPVGGRSRLWVRPLESLATRELPGTEGAIGPLWSLDSRALGFWSDGKLRRIDISGGSPVTLCESADYRGGAWSPDDVIVFSPGTRSTLLKVAASGGVPTAATVLGKDENGHARPSFLPDGRHFLYYDYATRGAYIASLDSTDRTVLFKDSDATRVVYTQGHLLYMRETTLMAQLFDADRLTLTGDAVPVAEEIQMGSLTPPNGMFWASGTALVYQTGAAIGGRQLTWFDRTGKALATVGDLALYDQVELSPDGTRAAVTVAGTGSVNTSDIWLVDLARGTRQRLTSDPGNELAPVWSPDGSRIVFDSNRSGNPDLYQKATSGVGAAEEAILQESGNQRAFSWSRDNQLIYQTTGQTAGAIDLWVLPLAGDRKPRPFLQNQFQKFRARISPDGRWVSYSSQESTRNEVYVASFPRADKNSLVSTTGGGWSRWRRDGRELFYVDPDNRLMAAEVDGQGATFKPGAVKPLFTINPTDLLSGYAYDVSPDGQRFLVISVAEQQGTSTPITVVMNWQAGLRK